MALSVAVYEMTAHGRSHTVCEAMAQGIKRCGDVPVRLKAETYRRPECEIAVFYGYTQELQACMADHRKRLGAVYVDLGYWGRHDGGRRVGYHKIAVNARHPTDYFRKGHSPDRFVHHKQEIRPFRTFGRHILIAGMSAKAAAAGGFKPEQWERTTIIALQRLTDRPLVYRPKPNWKDARPLPGAGYSPPKETMEESLVNCHAIVTHHSNVAVDGLLAGIPVFANAGVASKMGTSDLSHIDDPWLPDDRLEWAADIAYCQWSIAEMAEGLPWWHLKNTGMIP